MTRTASSSLAALILLPACFSPEVPADTQSANTETEGAGTTETAETTAAGPGTTGPEMSAGNTTGAAETDSDDGESGDGQSTTTIDPGTSSGGPSSTCGNGRLDDGEVCDDGNDENGDGCNNDCVESGSVLWESSFEGMEASALAINDDSEIIVLGNSRASTDVHYSDWRRVYSGDGETLSTGSTGNFDTSVIAASADTWVIAYLVDPNVGPGEQDPANPESYGLFGIARVDDLFQDEWSTQLPNTREIGAIHAHEKGGLILSGSVLNTGNLFPYAHDGFLAAYRNGGALDWERLDPDDGSPRDCHPSAAIQGGASVVGCVDSQRSVTVRRHHSNGTLANDVSLGSFTEAYEWINYFSPGRTYPSMAGGPSGQSALVMGAHVIALEPSGQVSWEETFQSTGEDQFLSSAFDGSGALLLAGRRQSASGTEGMDGFIVKVGHDGAVRWTHLIEGPDDDQIVSVTTSPTDEVAYCATLGHNTSSPELRVAMLTP